MQDGSYNIYVNTAHVKERRRFTVAHEVAHYVLHSTYIGNRITDNALYRSELSNRQESQANRLDAQILMPWELLNPLLDNGPTNISEKDGTVALAGHKKYLDEAQGAKLQNIWTDIIRIGNTSKERIGYPTQKPLALYERMILASSNEGDIILDPFCGCATTLVAAERLKRQWVGIDIWEKAHEVVIDRLKKEVGLFGKVHYKTKPPIRTDDGETSTPFLRIKERVKEPEGPKWSRQKMYENLLSKQGQKCQGYDREFDDPRYLELDHNTPRSDGGINHISNRILLCSPCNRLK